MLAAELVCRLSPASLTPVRSFLTEAQGEMVIVCLGAAVNMRLTAAAFFRRWLRGFVSTCAAAKLYPKHCTGQLGREEDRIWSALRL